MTRTIQMDETIEAQRPVREVQRRPLRTRVMAQLPTAAAVAGRDAAEDLLALNEVSES